MAVYTWKSIVSAFKKHSRTRYVGIDLIGLELSKKLSRLVGVLALYAEVRHDLFVLHLDLSLSHCLFRCCWCSSVICLQIMKVESPLDFIAASYLKGDPQPNLTSETLAYLRLMSPHLIQLQYPVNEAGFPTSGTSACPTPE